MEIIKFENLESSKQVNPLNEPEADRWLAEYFYEGIKDQTTVDKVTGAELIFGTLGLFRIYCNENNLEPTIPNYTIFVKSSQFEIIQSVRVTLLKQSGILKLVTQND